MTMHDAGECPHCDEFRAENPDPLAELKLAVAGLHDEVAAHREDLASLNRQAAQRRDELAQLRTVWGVTAGLLVRVRHLEGDALLARAARYGQATRDSERATDAAIGETLAAPVACPPLAPLPDGWSGLDMPATAQPATTDGPPCETAESKAARATQDRIFAAAPALLEDAKAATEALVILLQTANAQTRDALDEVHLNIAAARATIAQVEGPPDGPDPGAGWRDASRTQEPQT